MIYKNKKKIKDEFLKIYFGDCLPQTLLNKFAV